MGKVRKFILSNGLQVIVEERQSPSVTILFAVNVGSHAESEEEEGLAHFLEHIVFTGTKTKNAKELANEIEKVGGELNAFTSYEGTAFYTKVLEKDFARGIKTVGDIVINPIFRKKDIENEKKIILSEINMVEDEPLHYQWVLLNNVLFETQKYKHPIYGNKRLVSALTREKIVKFYQKNYSAINSVLVIVGNYSKDIEKQCEQVFGVLKRGTQKTRLPVEPIKGKGKTCIIKKKSNQSYLMLAKKVPPRLHKDSYVLDVIRSMLGRGQSGRLFDEIRNKRGIGYDVGCQHVSIGGTGYFAAYVSCDKKQLALSEKILKNEFSKLLNCSEKELEEAKSYIEGDHLLSSENPVRKAEQIASWYMMGRQEGLDNYLKNIKRVNKRDVQLISKKYFSGRFTKSLMLQQ